MAIETVKQCIKEFNEESFYSKNLDNSSFKKFNLYMSLLSVIKYEKSFYKTQGEYTKKVVNKISDELLPTIKHVILPKANGLYLDCWDINPTNSGKYIIFFSGIGTEKSNPVLQKAYEKFSNQGWGVIAFDYSGRGKSNGEFCQKSAFLDSNLVYDYLVKKGIETYNIGVLGHSIGAAVALDFAAKNSLSFVLLLNPFNKASDMVKTIAQHLFIPDFIKETVKSLPDFLIPIKNRFNNEKTLKYVEAPTLILHNKSDDTIPVRLSRKLYFRNKLKKNITYLELDGSTHDITQDKIDICLHFIEQSHIWFFNN